jgi:hypothetical protein
VIVAKRRKPKEPPAHPGDAFLMPLGDGRFGVCRVLRVHTAEPPAALVAASPWVGTTPDLGDPRLRETLRLTHHAWANHPAVLWVNDAVPDTFVRIGELPPDKAEAKAKSGSSSSWYYFPTQILAQWRWDHEREQVLAEDEQESQVRAAAQKAERLAYQPSPPTTLEEFRNRKLFDDWKDYADTDQLRASRKAIREAVDALIALGPGAGEPECIDVLRRCVERFNDIDDGWIDTICREDICGILDELSDLVGLDDYDESVFSNRDW